MANRVRGGTFYSQHRRNDRHCSAATKNWDCLLVFSPDARSAVEAVSDALVRPGNVSHRSRRQQPAGDRQALSLPPGWMMEVRHRSWSPTLPPNILPPLLPALPPAPVCRGQPATLDGRPEAWDFGRASPTKHTERQEAQPSPPPQPPAARARETTTTRAAESADWRAQAAAEQTTTLLANQATAKTKVKTTPL